MLEINPLCMPKLPALTPKKIVSILKRHGFKLDHTTGSHFVFYHPQNGRRVIVPFHSKDLPKGTLQSILKEAGISRDDI